MRAPFKASAYLNDMSGFAIVGLVGAIHAVLNLSGRCLELVKKTTDEDDRWSPERRRRLLQVFSAGIASSTNDGDCEDVRGVLAGHVNVVRREQFGIELAEVSGTDSPERWPPGFSTFHAAGWVLKGLSSPGGDTLRWWNFPGSRRGGSEPH